MTHKLGKLPPKEDARTLKFSSYAAALPEPPRIFGFGSLYSDWGMLGNDRYGDCVFAGAAHETMLWNKVRAGAGVKMSTAETLLDYSAVTGFDPSDPSTDNGAVVLDALKYRRSSGVRDAAGTRHKIAAYVSLDPTNWHELVQASYIFGAVGIGFAVPDTIWDQWDHGEYWDLVDPNAPIDGGHYVPVVGSRNADARVTIVTWGRRWQMTKRFYEAYNDEAFAILSEEQIRSDGTGLHGFDLAQLNADLAGLGMGS
jgi:hypothetical protein